MLADTRFRPHFDFVGDFATHYGIFPRLRHVTAVRYDDGRAVEDQWELLLTRRHPPELLRVTFAPGDASAFASLLE